VLLSLAQALRRRSGANGEAGPEGAQGRMPGVTESDSAARKADETTQGRESAIAKRQTTEKQNPKKKAAVPKDGGAVRETKP